MNTRSIAHKVFGPNVKCSSWDDPAVLRNDISKLGFLWLFFMFVFGGWRLVDNNTDCVIFAQWYMVSTK